MTIFDASSKLYAWFAENDSFSINTDEKKLLEDLKRNKFKRKEELAAIECALKDLEKLEMISPAKVGDDEVWVLRRSFQSLPQTISVSAEVCHSMSTVINGFCEAFDLNGEKADPVNIKEQDLKNLLYIAATLMDKASEDKKETE